MCERHGKISERTWPKDELVQREAAPFQIRVLRPLFYAQKYNSE